MFEIMYAHLEGVKKAKSLSLKAGISSMTLAAVFASPAIAQINPL